MIFAKRKKNVLVVIGCIEWITMRNLIDSSSCCPYAESNIEQRITNSPTYLPDLFIRAKVIRMVVVRINNKPLNSIICCGTITRLIDSAWSKNIYRIL